MTTASSSSSDGSANTSNMDDNEQQTEHSDLSDSVTRALSLANEAIHGRDSEGHVYSTISEMWGASNRSWYNRASDYYEENCPASLNGVLGGFASISQLDLEGSKKWLEAIIQEKRPALDWSTGAGCECGAGIGRVTKGLLLPLGVSRCDLVESSSRLLSEAPAFLGENLANKCRFYCCGLQEWTPPRNSYTIIWIQWVLCYLTDEHVVAFLRKCGEGLVPGGLICLKENAPEQGVAFVLDNEDASVSRSVPYLLELADQAGLQVISQCTQDNFPDEIFPVPMIALDVKPL